MTTNTDTINKILARSVFDLNTETLGRLRCRSISAELVMDKAFRKQLEAKDLDGPAFVRKLLVHIALRIGDRLRTNDDGEVGTRLSELDVRRLTDAEIESLSRKICVHHHWLFENHEESDADASVKPKKVRLSKKNKERDSDRLVHALRVHVANLETRGEELIKRFRKTELPLRRVELSISRLQRRFDQINQSFTPLADFHLQIESTLEPLTRISEHMRRSALVSKSVTEIVQANQHWQHLIDQATASSRWVADLTDAHRTWVQNLKLMQDQAAGLQVAAKLLLGDMAYRLTVSERMFARIDTAAIRQAIALPEHTILRVRDLNIDFTTTYRKLVKSLPTYADITRLPRFVLPSATREVFIANHAVDALGFHDEGELDRDSAERDLVEKAIEEISNCTTLLEAVDPQLATMYAGARDAIRGDNPDRRRHLLVSLRELLGHLLRKIAPDERVLAWITRGRDNWLHEGKPTRKARLLYLCREFDHGPMDDFVVSDTRAMVKFLEVFNRIHQPKVKLSDKQLYALLHRTESFVTFIVQIWMSDSE